MWRAPRGGEHGLHGDRLGRSRDALPVAIDGYVLYKGFFVGEISLPFKSGSSIVWFSLAWAVIGIGWALWWSRRRRLDSISLSAEV
jgi:hypothetical protein